MKKITDEQIFSAITEPMTVYNLAKKLGVCWESSLARRLRKFVKDGKLKRGLKGRFYYYFPERAELK